MAESAEELENRLRTAVRPGTRHRLLARGLARGMIWADGALPPEAPAFSAELSSDLLDHGYGVLARALRLRELDPDALVLNDAFRVAAEAIESTARRGESDDRARGFQLLVAAIASHLGGYAARAFTLMGEDAGALNLSSDERLLSLIARRSLETLRRRCVEWLALEEHEDRAIVDELASQESIFEIDDAIQLALRRNVYQAVGLFDSALVTGDEAFLQRATELLATGREVAAEGGFVSAWWVQVLLQHLADDLWRSALWTRLPDDESWASLRRDFIAILSQRATAEVTLWPEPPSVPSPDRSALPMKATRARRLS